MSRAVEKGHDARVRQVEGPEDVSQRDLVVGLVCVALLIAFAMAWLVLAIMHAPGAKAV